MLILHPSQQVMNINCLLFKADLEAEGTQRSQVDSLLGPKVQ